MPVEPEKLLAMKAFYLGHAIAERSPNRSAALDLIGAAIVQLGERSETTEKVRLAFYHILRAEVLRHGGSPIDDRRDAQSICREIGSPLYKYFLSIEEATHSRKTLTGIQTLYVKDGGIKQTESYWATDGWNSWEVRYDIASRTLGVNQCDLTDKERRFLEKVTLKDLLARHGIAHGP